MVEIIPDNESSAIRVLIANVPVPLEARIARAIEGQTDIQVVGHTRGYVEMLLAAQQDVDVVVLCSETVQPPPGICSHLLAERPDVKILLIDPNGDQAFLYWMGLYQKDLRGASAEVIVQTLRQLDALTAM